MGLKKLAHNEDYFRIVLPVRNAPLYTKSALYSLPCVYACAVPATRLIHTEKKKHHRMIKISDEGKLGEAFEIFMIPLV